MDRMFVVLILDGRGAKDRAGGEFVAAIKREAPAT